MKSSELLMLQEVWRRALKQDELALNFKTKRGAVRARMQLYNAIKAYRKGSMEDIELSRAAERLEIVWTGETCLKLQRKDKSDMVQGVEEALGQAMGTFVDTEAQAMGERMLQLLETPNEKAAEHVETPFYAKREQEV